MTKKTFKAFKIAHGFNLPGGKHYDKTSHFQARSESEEEILTKAQFAHELAAGVTPPPPPMHVAQALVAAAKDEGDDYEKGDGSSEPDWAYKTIAAMRTWLDQSGVSLPTSGASKATHEALVHDAWVSGRRPHPLYGFHGGPEPSPGLAGPVGVNDPMVFAAAIEAAHLGGFPISDETLVALEALTAETVEPEVPTATGSDENPQEGALGPDGEPQEGDASEPAGSTNESAAVTPEALLDDVLNSMEPEDPNRDPTLCEGCPNPATHEADGLKFCQTCWDALDPDETADGHQADEDAIPESE